MQLILGNLQTGKFATKSDYQQVNREIENLACRVPAYQSKVDETIYHENALIHVHHVVKTTLDCIHVVLERLLEISSSSYMSCFITELDRAIHIFKACISEAVANVYSGYDPALYPIAPLNELFPELQMPVMAPYPSVSQCSTRHEFVREIRSEIQQRGGLIANTDFPESLQRLKSLRTDLIRLDNEDIGSGAFRITLHRRLNGTILETESLVKEALELKPDEYRTHVYVYHSDYTSLIRRLKQFLVYRVHSH